MSKCVRCKIEVRDDSIMCPLCHGVLSEAEGEHEPMYPDVSIRMRKMNFILKLVIFISVLVEIACIIVNYLTYNGVKWSIASGLGLIYVCFTLIYSARRNKSHQRKMIMQLLLGLVLVFAVDKSLGYWGWSVAYAIPIAIILMNVGVAVLILVNKNNRQSYVMAQIWLSIMSAGCLLIDWWIGKKLPLLAVIALGVSVLTLSASLVFGDKPVRSELHRRFHI